MGGHGKYLPARGGRRRLPPILAALLHRDSFRSSLRAVRDRFFSTWGVEGIALAIDRAEGEPLSVSRSACCEAPRRRDFAEQRFSSRAFLLASFWVSFNFCRG